MAGPPPVSIGGELPIAKGDDPRVGSTDGMSETEAARQQAIADAKAAAEANRVAESRFQYGGWAGGAAEAASRYNTQGIAGQQRLGERIDYSGANYDRNNAAEARSDQQSVADLMRARAEGRTPSIASMVGAQNINRAVADQSSIAAGARGPAALALAQQQNANNSANAVSTINNQTQVNAAQERLAAENSAFGAYSGIRGGDFNAGAMSAQQAQSQAAINAAQRTENDRYQLGMTQAEIDVQKAQLGAQGNKVGIQSGASTAAAALAQNQSQYDSSRVDKYIGMGVGAAGAVGGAVLLNAIGGSPGPAAGGVGEAGVAGATDSGYGAPGSTPGGYDAETGAPQAGTGGGYDPDHPGSDDRMKSPASIASMVADRDRRTTYSDDHTKVAAAQREAYLLGRAHQNEQATVHAPIPFAYGGPPRAGEDIKDPEPDEMTGPRGKAHPAGGRAASSTVTRPDRAALPPEQHWAQRGIDGLVASGMVPASGNTVYDAMDGASSGLMSATTGKPVPALGDTAAEAYFAPPAPMSARQPRVAESRFVPARQLAVSTKQTYPEKAYGGQSPSEMIASTYSDEDTKGVVSLDNPENGYERHWDRDVAPSRAKSIDGGASLSGPAPRYGVARAVEMHQAPDAAPKTRKMTDAELQRYGEGMLANTRAQSTMLDRGPSVGRSEGPPAWLQNEMEPSRTTSDDRSKLSDAERRDLTSGPAKWEVEWNRSRGNNSGSGMSDEQDDNSNPQPYDDENVVAMRGGGGRGPSIASMMSRRNVGTLGKEVDRHDMAEFARSLRSVPYAYKPEFAAREGQRPGEVNIGPVAQEIEKSRVGATIVKPDARGSGMRTLDETKMVKGLGGVAAAHQDQLDEHERKLSRATDGDSPTLTSALEGIAKLHERVKELEGRS